MQVNNLKQNEIYIIIALYNVPDLKSDWLGQNFLIYWGSHKTHTDI